MDTNHIHSTDMVISYQTHTPSPVTVSRPPNPHPCTILIKPSGSYGVGMDFDALYGHSG